MKHRLLYLVGILIVSLGLSLPVASSAEEARHHCVGLLWCTDTHDGGVSTDAVLHLYSSEERGSYSRLAIRPFYSEEIDPTKDLLRRSVLWPLGNYIRTGDTVSLRIVPVYWHGEEPGKSYTVIPPFYIDYSTGDRSYFYALPLYVHLAQGDSYHQRFFLGPLLINTEDTHRDLHRWDFFFPLGGHRSDVDGDSTWFVPVYFSGHHNSDDRDYFFALPVYGHSESPGSNFLFVFPVFGSEQDDTAQFHRFSLLGLPPLKGVRSFPTLSLYERVTASDFTSHRFFPLYGYTAHDTEGTQLDVLLAYQHRVSDQIMVDRLYPLYDYRREGAEHSLSLAGISEFSLFRHQASGTVTRHRLFPLYDYRHDGAGDSLSVGGVSELSLFRRQVNETMTHHRLFPLYSYNRDENQQSTTLDALLLYRDESSPTKTSNRLFPLWNYEDNHETHETRLDIAGWAKFSLYQALTTPTQHSRRLLPVYTHTTDLATGKGETNVLWPFFNAKSQDGETTEWSALWWLANYRKPTSDSYEFRLFGGSKMALLRRTVSPERSTFEFNPVLPLYAQSTEPGKGTSWKFGHGLVGVEADEQGQTRWQLFWWGRM